MDRELYSIEKRINEYINKLDEISGLEQAGNELSEEEIRSALEKLKERKKKFKSLYNRLKEGNEISTVDPDKIDAAKWRW